MKKELLMLSLVLCLVYCNVGAQVTFNGKNAAVDTLTGTWLLSVPKAVFGTDYDARITLGEGVSKCLIDNVEVTDRFTFNNVQPGSTYQLWALCGTDTVRANIQFTYWPVIQIYGSFAKTPYHTGTVIYTHPDSLTQPSISSRVRWAGSSTAANDRLKHNFHLKFYNEDGSKKDMSFFGLRHDFHWRLDAGQVDFARVRNRVAKDIWAEFAHQPYYAAYEPKRPYNYVRGDFVEVFLNDEYMGIYSLNEHMDRQQLKLKPYDYGTGEFHGGLWKPMQWSYVTVFSKLIEINAQNKKWDSFYVKYPNIDDVKPTNFATLYHAIDFAMNSTRKAFIDSAQYYYDIPVWRDYYLFTILLQAPDNVGKNVYYACYDVATDPRLTIAIWDLDCTQGQFWSNQGANYHHSLVGPEQEFKNTQLGAHKVFKRLNATDVSFHGLATERYWELRGTTFNPDTIVARYATYFAEMKSCGADQREITRWSRCKDLAGHDLDFNTELSYLNDWWQLHIAYLDANVFIPYPEGDINFDHNVNVSDVTVLIDYLLNGDTAPFNSYKADVDNSGQVDVADVASLIDLVLSPLANETDSVLLPHPDVAYF